MKGNNFNKQISIILRHGIIESGTRYECQKKLVWHYWSLNFSKDECDEAIEKWYYKHDHQSKDWKANPKKVLRDLKSAINSLYDNSGPRGYFPRRKWQKRLRAGDVQNIVSLTADYRLQKFIFCLLVYGLNKISPSNEFDLPRVVIVTFDCCSYRNYQGKIRFCESVGLITKEREYYMQDGRARRYKLYYSFSKEGKFINSLEEGLAEHPDLKELKLGYSRWTNKKIREAISANK